MLTYVIMKLLERRPERYDARLARLSRGHILRVRERAVALLAAALPREARILELGCGTGALALALAAHGFRVTAIDASPTMIAEAERRRRATLAHPARCTACTACLRQCETGAIHAPRRGDATPSPGGDAEEAP